jgi:gamma-glutamyl-gamma-aminobutyrate hydrolase PuuD
MTTPARLTGVVAVLSAPDELPGEFFHVVEHGEGVALAVSHDHEVPAEAGALLVIGTSVFDGVVPHVLSQALGRGMPVLGVGWGMHAINFALGGRMPVPVEGDTGVTGKMLAFISPGGKLSYTITGSGWVSVPFSNKTGLKPADLAPGMMASCYREDGFVAVIEMPGRNWVIGVQWNAHEINAMPSNFDNLLLALVERATGVQ